MPNYFIHGSIIDNKTKRANYPKVLAEVKTRYLEWRNKSVELNSEDNNLPVKKVCCKA